MTESSIQPLPTRDQIAQFASDPRTLLALEALFRQGNVALPTDIAAFIDIIEAGTFVLSLADPALPGARVLTTASTGLTVDLSTAGLLKLVLNALANLNALSLIAFTKAITATAGLTVTGDTATTTLHTTGAATVGNSLTVTAGGASVAGGAAITGGTVTDTLRINEAATASVAVTGFSAPINLNGTTYYLLLSATP